MSCPIKSSKEFKLLQNQLGSEEAAIYTWKSLGEEYPTTLKSTSALKTELGVKTKMSNDQIVALANEVKRYNKFNGTSHSFTYKKFAQTTDYTVDFNVSYLPVRKEISRLELFEQNPIWTNMPVDIRRESNLQGLPEIGDDFFMGDQALREQEDLAFYRSEPSMMDLLLKENPQNNLSTRVTDNTRAREIASKLSEQLGVDFSMVTPEEAKELTKNAKNPWSGEPAFFIGGKVYFVADSLTTNIALHEFSHPLVRSIAKENKALFDNLYKGLKETSEGRELIQEVLRLYPELNESDPLFKEEVIVRAIEKQGAGLFKTSTGFAKVINDILYAIKQMLRRIFGQKADVSKLNPNTTLEQLTTMLVSGNKFVINTEVVNDEDVIAYARQQTAEINDTLSIKNTEVQDLINQVFTTANKHIKNLQNNRELDELAKILVDDFKASDLAVMSGNLSKYQTVINNKADRFKEDMEYQTKQATALVNTLYRLDNMTAKIAAHMEDIIQNPNADNHNLGRVHYYDALLTQWLDVVTKGKVILNDPKNKVSSKSPLMQVIKSIETSIERSKSLINDIKADGARDTLYNELEPMGRDIKTRYDGIIEGLKKRKAPQKEIDKWHKEYYGLTEAEFTTLKTLEALGIRTPEQEAEYKKLKSENAQGLEISKAKIESLLKGQAGDANYFNSYLEGYLYNTDPVIGGLALYVKNKMTEVMAIAQAKNNDFASDMKPLIEKAGFSGHRIGELGTRIGELDVVGQVNEKGELEEKQVWTLKSKFKGYRYAVDKLNHDVTVAQTAWSNSGSDTDRAALVKAISTRKKHMRKWFHQQYSDAYYEREELFESDDIGAEAAYRRDNLLEDIKLMGASAQTPGQQLEITETLDKLWSDYRQLHSLYNTDGSKKEGTELEIAKRLIQYRDASREFHTFEPREGAFQNALSSYEQEIINDGNAIGSPAFISLRTAWLHANTRVRIKSSFYARRQEIFDELKEIFSSVPNKESLDMTIEWEEILEKSGGFRDEDGQLKATEMSPATIAEIKKLQEQILKKKKEHRDQNKFSPAKKLRFNELQALKAEKLISAEETAELDALYKSIPTSGLTEGQKLRLEALYEELGDLSRTEPTEYYVHTLNDWLQQLNTDKIETKLNSRIVSIGTAAEILTTDILNDLFKQSPEFEAWFKKNHLQREVFNPETKQMEMKWERLYVWNIIKPNDPEHMETTKIMTAEGKPDVVEGLPTNKYYERVVKAQDDNGRPIETKQIVGVTVDNRGDWLPKDVPNSPYLNDSYTKLNAADKAVLDKLTEHHLRNQEGLDRKSKLYLDFPRFRKSTLEAAQTSNVAKEKWNGLTIWAKRVRNFWTGAKDDAQSGMNEKENFNLVKVDVFDNELTGVPVAGLYDIEPQDVSTDITTILMRYMFSVERQKQLIKISPFARAVQSVVKDSRNEVLLDSQLKANFVTRTIQIFKGKKSVSIREKAVDNFLERELEGQNITGYTKDIPWINNLQSTLNARASFGFFALNIPSALKNAFGAKFQGMIEASAGTNMNQLTFARAEGTSLKTMMEISAQVYAKGPKSLNVQLVELMDPAQGRFEDKIGESLSRTITKDVASMTWLYNFRKWTELQATLQIFFGMMHHKRIEQKQPDGTTKQIEYANAWEVKDGKIQLKEGIDPAWGITYNSKGEIQVGAEYTKMRNRVHQVMNNLQGAYSKFDQPEAQRYLMFRFVSFLRRYFTTMFTNRWGFSGKWHSPKPRLNPGMGDVQMGYYITFLKTAKSTFLQLGRNLPHMTQEERGAALKVITEIGALVIASALMGLLFGWDPDDEDRFAKLRAKSGALPFPLSPDDPSRPFDGFGFLENHALYLLMNIRAENEQLVPFSGFGLDDYSQMLGMQSIAFKPTVQNYVAIVDDMVNIIQGDEKAYYQREVGPYSWQKEGSPKIWSRLATIVGLSGSALDPAKAIRGFQSSQALKR